MWPESQAYLELCLERDRLLCSPEFARAPVMSKLLAFLIDHKLSGAGHPPKAYAIAVDALGRSEDFDPDTDSYPRVQMSRLRKMIDDFYLRNGGDIRMSVPLNSYDIELERQPAGTIGGAGSEETVLDSVTAPANDPGTADINEPAKDIFGRRKWYVGFLLLLVLLTAGLGYWKMSSQPPVKQFGSKIDYPKIAIQQGHSSGDAHQVSEQAGSYIAMALSRFETLETILEQSASGKFQPDYRLVIKVTDTSRRRINLDLVEGATSRLVWSNIIPVPDNPDEVNRDLAKAVVTIAGPYGAIAQDQAKNLRSDYSVGYPCLLQANSYIRFRNQEQLDPVFKCLTRSVQIYPNDAYLLGMLSFVNWIAQDSGSNLKAEGSGKQWADRAIALDSSSASAAFAEARAAFFKGDCERGREWGLKAVERNPLDSLVSGYLAIYLVGCGDPEAKRYAEETIEIDKNADLSVYAILSFLLFMEGDYESAYTVSKNQIGGSQRTEPSLEAAYMLASLATDRRPEAKKIWDRLCQRSGQPGSSDIDKILNSFVVNPRLRNFIIEQIAEYDFPACA